MDDIKNLDIDALVALRASRREALDALFASVGEDGTPTDEQVAEAETLAADIDTIDAEHAERTSAEQAAAASATSFASLRERFAAEDEDPEDEPAEEEPAEEEVPEVEKIEEAAAVTAAAKPRVSNVKRLAAKTKRPTAPAVSSNAVTITAAADTGKPAGSVIDMKDVAEAWTKKARSFPKPSRAQRGSEVPRQHFDVASFAIEYPEDLVVGRPDDALDVMNHARREDRLPEGSLVAAGGWCAPSETIYDLCEGETLSGLVDLPEVSIKRGGINFTKGPQFSDFYGTPWTDGAGFMQTEAQAIAGDTKDCFQIDCPEFEEVRLDAVGLCIEVPILTNAAYPELVRRIVSGALTAHQHRMSWEKIRRMVTLSGTARDLTNSGLGSTVSDSLEALELVANIRRQQFAFDLDAPMEVILPFWAKSMFRADLGRRAGVAAEVISDAQVMAHFAAHNLAPQFVYHWQPLAANATEYPAEYEALMYPAGTFVAGVADVIDLQAVYDAASLKENVYTGTFTEQGLLVAEMCYDSDRVTLPVCNAGRTGAQDLTCVPAVTP